MAIPAAPTNPMDCKTKKAIRATATSKDARGSTMTEQDISPFKALDFIRDNAPMYAQAKANVTYMTEYRKTIKALLMNESQAKTESAKESYAYSSPRYVEHLKAMQQAIAEAERLRWLMIAAEAKIEVWRSLESSARAEGRSTQ